MPAILLAGVMIALVLVFLGALFLGRQGHTSSRVHVTVSFLPPKLEIKIEQGLD
jgi:hypothetical protein